MRRRGVVMRMTWLAHIRCGLLLLFASLGSVLVTSLLTQHGKASAIKSVRAATQSPPNPIATRGKYNGKLVFSSNRQKEGGLKLWTMNADGSNPTQLTFESDRGPTLPSYVHLYEGGARWSPDGSMIAFFSNRDAPPADPQLDNYTLYIMDYPTRNTRRLVFNQLASFTSATCSNIGYFDWSPDGSRFVLSVASGGDSCQGP